MKILHASCVVFNEKAVLLSGPSGVGKTDVALRLLALGGQLVSDDQTQIEATPTGLVASPPAAIAGMIELRHIGLARTAFCPQARVALFVDLVAPDALLERLPDPAFYSLLDWPVRALKLCGQEASTPIKIKMVLCGALDENV